VFGSVGAFTWSRLNSLRWFSMIERNGDYYATQTGMTIKPSRAYPQIGADLLFLPFDVSSYQSLTAALAHRLIDPETKLMVFQAGQHTLALVLK
jgi:hypothetical protein